MTETVSPETVERMVALVRDMAEKSALHLPRPIEMVPMLDEARAIAAEFPASVDPDREAAISLAEKHGWGKVSATSNIADVLTEAVKLGRQQQREAVR